MADQAVNLSGENKRIKCPHCGRKTTPGPFCDRCGKEKQTAADQSSAQSASRETESGDGSPGHRPVVSVPPLSVDREKTTERVADPSGVPSSVEPDEPREVYRSHEPDETPPARVIPVPPEPREAASSPRGADSMMGVGGREQTRKYSCSHLNIEYDRRQIFVADCPAVLRFRITPLKAGLENMSIWFEYENIHGTPTIEPRRINWKNPTVGRTRTINHRFKPPQHGALCGMLYFGFRHDGDDYIFEADEEFHVYPGERNAGQVLNELTLNIHNDVKTGHAADVDIRQSLGEIEGLMGKLRPESPIVEVLDGLRGGTPAFCTLEVYPSTWTPPQLSGGLQPLLPFPPAGTPSSEAIAARLTLHCADQRIHLLGLDQITMGKNRENHLVTRLFDDDGIARSEGNQRISRRHAHLCRRNGELFVRDGVSEGNGSMWGTFLDGKPVESGTGIPLAANATSALLSLAGAGEEQEGVFALHLTPWTCEKHRRQACREMQCQGDRRIAALIMRRRDAVKECYLAIWACCPMKLILPGAGELTFWRRQEAFAWGNGDRNGWIQPGDTIPAGDETLRVTEWQQYGL